MPALSRLWQSVARRLKERRDDRRARTLETKARRARERPDDPPLNIGGSF